MGTTRSAHQCSNIVGGEPRPICAPRARQSGGARARPRAVHWQGQPIRADELAEGVVEERVCAPELTGEMFDYLLGGGVLLRC